MKKSKITHKLAAVITLGALAGISGEASAGATKLTDLTTNVAVASGGLPNLISMIGYIGGTGLGVAGILKLKQHVDNPGQVQIKDGLARLAAGGALFSLPFITTAMQGSISDGDTAAIDTNGMKVEDTTAFGGP